MKSMLKMLPVAGLALGLAWGAAPVAAQQAEAPSPAAVAAAKEILKLKNASAMYANAVPGMVEKVKGTLIGQNLNYQKDLNEIAPIVAKQLAGREQEIGDGMAGVYAGEFTEQELKDLVTFYKSPLGQKLIANEPKAISLSMQVMNAWAQSFSETVLSAFRAEMRKRGKEI
jgi:uncharacterized protein